LIDDGYFNFDEVDYIVFQTSYPNRCHYTLENGEKFRLSDNIDENVDFFMGREFISIDDYENKLVKQLFEKIKQTFQYYEEKGITPLIFNITNEYDNLFEMDEYMSNHRIKIKYDNKIFNSVNEVPYYYPYLSIHNDYEFFGENPPEDYHPSKKFHRIIADNIIERIKEINRNNHTNHSPNCI
jgi:hypothetical protein